MSDISSVQIDQFVCSSGFDRCDRADCNGGSSAGEVDSQALCVAEDAEDHEPAVRSFARSLLIVDKQAFGGVVAPSACGVVHRYARSHG